MLAAHPAEVTSILQPGCGSGGYHHDLQLGWDKVFLRKERNYKTDTSHPQTRLLFPPPPPPTLRIGCCSPHLPPQIRLLLPRSHLRPDRYLLLPHPPPPSPTSDQAAAPPPTSHLPPPTLRPGCGSPGNHAKSCISPLTARVIVKPAAHKLSQLRDPQEDLGKSCSMYSTRKEQH